MNLAKEALRGARKIAVELYDDEAADEEEQRKNERKIYHKFENGQFDGCVWKEGNELITTRTALRKHYRIGA
jgi:hypothetical protein